MIANGMSLLTGFTFLERVRLQCGNYICLVSHPYEMHNNLVTLHINYFIQKEPQEKPRGSFRFNLLYQFSLRLLQPMRRQQPFVLQYFHSQPIDTKYDHHPLRDPIPIT